MLLHVRSRPAAVSRDVRIRSARRCPRICWSSSACSPSAPALAASSRSTSSRCTGCIAAGWCARSSACRGPRPSGTPSAFTGFDAGRRYAVRAGSRHRPPAARRQHHAEPRRRPSLAVAERKATSFTISPLHVGSAAARLSAGGELRRGHHARRGDDDVGRGGELEHGPGSIARDDVPADRVQRAAGRLARQSRRRRRRDLEARRAGIRRRAARQRAARAGRPTQSVRAPLRRRPLRQPRPLRDGAAPLPLSSS